MHPDHVLVKMKGTEVPNPRRSSACDCTCVLIRNRTRSVTHACHRILFCSCPCKVRSRVSDDLSQALCNLCLAFLADFTLSDCTAPIRFVVKLFSLAHTLYFSFGSKDYSVHVFRLTGTAALHCGHTFVGGILPTANNRTRKERLSQNRMAR